MSDAAPLGGSKAQLSPSTTATSSSLPPPPPSSAAPLLPPSGGDAEDDEGMKHLQQVGAARGTFQTNYVIMSNQTTFHSLQVRDETGDYFAAEYSKPVQHFCLLKLTALNKNAMVTGEAANIEQFI